MFIWRSQHLQNAMTLLTRPMNRFWVSLSLLTLCWLLFTDLKNSSFRGTNEELDIVMLYSFQDTYHCWGEGGSQVPICLPHVHVFISFFNHPSHSRIDRNLLIILTWKHEEDSTMNLLHHIKSCEDQVVEASKSIANYAHGSMYSKAELHYLVSLWVFQCHRPFTIINDKPLQWILWMLYTKVETPSVTMISQDIKEIHGILKIKVREVL